MFERPLELDLEPLAQSRESPVAGREGSAEEAENTEPGPTLEKLSRKFEGDRSTSAKADNAIRTIWLERLDFVGEEGGQILDAGQGLRGSVKTRRLQAKEGLLLSQVPCQGAEAEDIPVMAAKSKHGRARPAWLQRHDGMLLPGERGSRMQEIQNLAFVLAQLVPQLGGQRAERSIAPQLIAVRPDLNIPVTEHRKEKGDLHNTTSSRFSTA
jgi:hypothetical protein